MPPAGVELATFSLGRSYSIQLSYGGVSYILASFRHTSKFLIKKPDAKKLPACL